MASPSPDPFAHRPRRCWRRVSVEVSAGLVEAVADLLAEATGAGVEIAPAPPGADGSARERVVGYLPEGPEAGAAEATLRERVAAAAGRAGEAGRDALVRSEPLLEEDWGAGWKEHFRPFHVAPRLVVRPGWEPYEAQPGEAVIEMDPGMAFGTGLHASTRLALGIIEGRCAAAPPARVLDVGTGTGILAMAAALRGAGSVLAIDNDPDAVAAAQHNVERNGLEARVRVGGEPLAEVGGPFDLIAANITADVLLALAPQLVGRLAADGALVLSGILAGEQAREVREGFERLGLRCAVERAEGEWAALLLSFSCGEVFEVVDERGRVIGRAPRADCHGDPSLVHRVSHVLVTDARGRLYLQQRPLTKDIQPGRWDTSVGGHLDLGETHEAAARREMREELGLEGQLRFLHAYLWRTERETELVETFLHETAVEPRPAPGEIDGGGWFTPAEAATLVARGEATPNLGEELRRLAAAGGLPGGARP